MERLEKDRQMMCVDKRASVLRRELLKQALKQERTYRRDEKWAGRAGPPDCAHVPDCARELDCVHVPACARELDCVHVPVGESAAEWDVVGPDDLKDAGDGARPCIARCTVS
jgi:hypothetical protein